MLEKDPTIVRSNEEFPPQISDADLRLACIAHDLGWIAGSSKLFDTRKYVQELRSYPSAWGYHPIPEVHPNQLELV